MKNRSHRLLSLLLLLILALTLTPQTARAVETETVEDTIVQGLLDYESRIDIASFEIEVSEIASIMQAIQNTTPELFHVDSRYSYEYNQSTGKVTALKPQYLYPEKDFPAMREFYEMKLFEIMALAPKGASDIELLLFYHDYLCLNFAYDTTYSRFDVYSFVKDGTGVCQSYTLLYLALLEASGIEAGVAVSTEMEHIWNIVTLNGRSYHIDVTWDDALTDNADVPGRAKHENFLLSDAGIAATGHHDWTPLPATECTDTRYEDASHKSLFADYDGAFAFLGAEAYGIRNGTILRFDDTLLEASEVYTVEEAWRPYGSLTHYYSDKYAGLASHGSLLYYNTPSALYSLDPVTLSTMKLKEVTGGTAFGLYRKGNELLITAGEDANLNGGFLVRYPLPALCEEHDYRLTGETSPSYESEGTRLSICSVCGDRKTEVIPPLTRPTAQSYRASLAALKEARSAEEFIAALALLKELEPLIPAQEIAEERAEVAALVAAYDESVTAARADTTLALSVLLEGQSILMGGLLSLLAVFLLVIKHIL